MGRSVYYPTPNCTAHLLQKLPLPSPVVPRSPRLITLPCGVGPAAASLLQGCVLRL